MTRIPSRFSGIDIPTDNPFKNDKLGYSKYAAILKGMVDMYRETGCVIALNGKWGAGKTTFMHMWKAYLPSAEYSTVYFNAWETDYYSDPLTAVLGEFKEISNDSEKFKSAVATLGKFFMAAGGAAIKGVIKKTTGIDSDVIKDSVDEAKSALQDSLDDYTKQKQSLTEFKGKLSEFVADQDGKTVVFIIDELDRCNPHYAVRVLEIVKHLFDVPNICFVLAIDKNQLECSIKGFYGSSEIDAESYLRRFIDIEFRMPEPNIEGFTALLFDNYNFNEVFDCLKNRSGHDEEDFCALATSLCTFYHLDLRTYDKVIAHTRLVLEQQGTETILIEVALLLCFLRVVDNDFFSAISAHVFTVQELLNEFEKKYPRDLLSKTDSTYTSGMMEHRMTFLITFFLMMYNCIDGSEIESVFHGIREDSEVPLECSVIDKGTMQSAAVYYKRAANINYGLRRVLNSVNLAKQFQ